jgi:hypothetical protein
MFGAPGGSRTLKHLILNQAALPVCPPAHMYMVGNGGIEPLAATAHIMATGLQPAVRDISLNFLAPGPGLEPGKTG